MLRQLIVDKTDDKEKLSLSRSVALGIFVILSVGLILHVVYAQSLPWEFFIAYPAGVSLAFAPQLFLRILETIREIVVTYKGGAPVKSGAISDMISQTIK